MAAASPKTAAARSPNASTSSRSSTSAGGGAIDAASATTTVSSSSGSSPAATSRSRSSRAVVGVVLPLDVARQLAHPRDERLDVAVRGRPDDGAPPVADVRAAVGLVGFRICSSNSSRRRSATMPLASWLSRSGKPPSHVATSGARRTRSRRRRSTSARRAISRSARTASARPAAITRAARSSRFTPTLRSLSGMSRIAVDAMGGDRGPEAVVEGALAARADGIEPIIFGAAGLDTRGLELVETTQVVGMDEKPADVLRTKEDSSLVRAAKAVADGEASAVVSPGNTGAMLAAGLVVIRRLPGRAPARARRPDPHRERAVGPRRCRRERRLPPRAPPPVRRDGRGLRRGRSSVSSSRQSVSCRSARNRRRATSSRSRRTRCSRPPTSTSGATPRAATSSTAPRT